MKKTVNERFIENLEYLKKRGVSYTYVEEMLKLSKGKIRNIKHGRSTAKYDLLEALETAFPQVAEINSNTKNEELNFITKYTGMTQSEFTEWKKSIDESMDELKADNKLLKRLLNQLLDKLN